MRLCVTCHAWCHANPREAQGEGYMISRHSDVVPAEIPVMAYFGWVHLDHDGNYEEVSGGK